jgi:hypothetical protein
MKLEAAKAECERWFSHLKRQEEKAIALKKLACERRAGTCSAEEGRRRVAQINGPGVTVYDGANLQKAVKVILKHLSKGDRP